MFDQKICILGYSGHAYVVIEALKKNNYFDIWYADRKVKDSNPFELKYAGFEKAHDFPWGDFFAFAIGIGNNFIRTNITNQLRARSISLLTVVHPEAHVSDHVHLGSGTFIARGACINPLVEIGNDVIINTAASVDHECIIENGAHIAPGAVLAGNVKIGEQVFIGANAVIKEGITIGSEAVIGAGAVVVNDVKAYQTVIGNPAREKKE